MGTSVLSGVIAACFVFLGKNSELYWLGGTLLALSSGIQGFGRIAYDSYLPILVRGSIDCTTILNGHGGDDYHYDCDSGTDDDDDDDDDCGSSGGDVCSI